MANPTPKLRTIKIASHEVFAFHYLHMTHEPTSAIIGTVKSGTKVKLLGQYADKVRIQTPEGLTGYIPISLTNYKPR